VGFELQVSKRRVVLARDDPRPCRQSISLCPRTSFTKFHGDGHCVSALLSPLIVDTNTKYNEIMQSQFLICAPSLVQVSSRNRRLLSRRVVVHDDPLLKTRRRTSSFDNPRAHKSPAHLIIPIYAYTCTHTQHGVAVDNHSFAPSASYLA
jgi:hypothetical protein